MDNYAIADQFSLLAKLMDIHGENAFKSKSYAVAAFNIEQLPQPLADTSRAEIGSLKGIGESTAKKIFEIIDTGRLSALDELIRKTPPGVLDMLQIKGLGPKKIATIWKEMGVETIGELLYACQENRLLLFKGFGEKTQQQVKTAIEFFLRHQGQFLYAELEAGANQLIKSLSEAFPGHEAQTTGAFRRQATTLEQLDCIVTIPADLLRPWLHDKGFSVEADTTSGIRCRAGEGAPIQIHLSTEALFGAALFTTTATEAFRQAWQDRGYTIPETAASEEDVFREAGISYIEACLREDGRFIPLAASSALPKLIRDADIRGIIHSHSDWSDGSDTLEAMARACIAQGLEYLVISDHSKSAFYAKGLTEDRVLAQQKLIRALNETLKPFRIFSSIECDILGDGSLDYADDVLAGFDLVIASIHSNLRMTPEKSMQRLLGAVRNPYTTILGHPTGRLLLSREGYPVDHDALIEACVAQQVVIEINAHPRRLDLDWSWISVAIDKGAMLSIDPDAHAIDGFHDIHYGVLAAQKGGLTTSSNLSSMGRNALTNWLEQRRQRLGI
jgi:DNA polymerase (family 10)